MDSFGPKARSFFEAHPDWKPSVDSFCPVGWDEILAQALGDLHELAERRRVSISIAQIKEKFAQLRIYVSVKGEPRQIHFDLVSERGVMSGKSPRASKDSVTAEAAAIVNRASDLSRRVCERCGEPGRLRSESWMRILCEQHARELK